MDKFFEDGVKAIKQARGDDTQLVFIFDSLEQIRGSLSNEQEVIRSVERLFANHFSMLKLPYVHAIYTVPPWLKFVMPNLLDVYILPSVRQWNNDTERSQCGPGWHALLQVIHRRFEDEAGFKRFFGDDPLADKLIAVCGGHFRDLLLLLREAVLRAESLPILDKVVDSAITAVQSNFLPIATDDAMWLDKIGKLRKTALPTVKPEDVSRLTRFLDTHFVLYLTNGEEWYDIHPLIRDEVAEIVKRQALTTSAPNVAPSKRGKPGASK